jgi:hypothetical protein
MWHTAILGRVASAALLRSFVSTDATFKPADLSQQLLLFRRRHVSRRQEE